MIALIAQLVEHVIGNLRVALVEMVHPSTHWRNGYLAYGQDWHHDYLPVPLLNGSGVMLPCESRWIRNIQLQSGDKVT